MEITNQVPSSIIDWSTISFIFLIVASRSYPLIPMKVIHSGAPFSEELPLAMKRFKAKLSPRHYYHQDTSPDSAIEGGIILRLL